MWVECSSCNGTGTNPIEVTCISCGGRGAVFKECCGCRDCREKEGINCPIDDCPKDHSELPVGDIPSDQ